MKAIVRNLAVHYEDQGNSEGRVMLFLHGWKNDLSTFDPLVSELPSSYRIVRLDLPGFGGSEMPHEDWSLDDHVDFIVDFMKKIGVQTDVLIGHSLGGRIIIKGVARGAFHPKKVVLIASAGIAKRRSLRNGIITLFAKTGKAMTTIPPFSSARESLRKKLYENIGSDYGNAGAMKGTFLKVIAEDLSRSARKIGIPMLLIWGERDKETPLEDGKRMQRLVEGSILTMVPGSGHFVHREEPREVARMIKEFVSS